MTTWIGHLRIAENLFPAINGLDETAFTFGSIAPDSGIPNADWTHFDPPKEISHYLSSPANGESGVEDLRFYREHLAGMDPAASPGLYSFYLGYYIHLLCDRLWMLKVGLPSKAAYPDLFYRESEVAAWDTVKKDWYGLDQCFVRDHPQSLFWRVFMVQPVPRSPLPFVQQDAFEHQVKFIRDFYSHPDPGWVLDRVYPYLNERSMTAFVNQASTAVLKLLRLLKNNPDPNANTGIELLSAEDAAPLPFPLGDIPY